MTDTTTQMTEQQKKEFSALAVKMRVLKGPAKNRYLYELDEYAKDCRVREAYHQRLDTFLPHRLARHLYNALEGVPYTQPEFASQATWQDRLAREKFEAIFAGVTAYPKASNAEKESFKKSALMSVGPIQKIASLIKGSQNGKV